MGRTIQQIKKDLTVLEETVANLAVEIRSIYLKYLGLLSQATRQQLILATYQICTHIYPDSFLKLSFSQREKMQKNLRILANKAQPMLAQSLQESNRKLLLKEQQQESLPSAKEEPNQEDLSNPTAEIESQEKQNEEKEIIISNPNELIYWQLLIEEKIYETLSSLSTEANGLLMQAGIVPKKLPAKVMEMALQAEEGASPISGLPNLLDFLIETGNNDEPEEGNITKMTAIRLRLTEIEFADHLLGIERNQIRTLLARIEQIQKQYQKIKQECAVAEAETAWRSSWFDS